MYLTETEQGMLPDMLNVPTPGVGHFESEAHVEGKWAVADVAMRPEIHAQSGVPIAKFGEDAIGLVYRLIPESITHTESIQLKLGIAMKAGAWLVPVVWERGSIIFTETLPLGRKIIEEAGGIEAYDQNARRRGGLFSAEEIARKIQPAERPQVVEFKE